TAQIEHSLTDFAKVPNGGLTVSAGPVLNVHRELIIELAARYGLPAVYSFRYFVTSGGLVYYGADDVEPYRRAADYVDRILRGEKPADLPVQQATKFEMILNAATAKALGLTIPNTLLATADEVIE